MPWKLFFLLHRELDHVLALDRLNDAEAVGAGVAFQFADKAAAQKIGKEMAREAFPTV